MQNGGCCEKYAEKKAEKQEGSSGVWDDYGDYHSDAVTVDPDSAGFHSYIFFPSVME